MIKFKTDLAKAPKKHKQTNKQNPQVILIKKCEIFDRLLCSVRWSSVQRLRLSL